VSSSCFSTHTNRSSSADTTFSNSNANLRSNSKEAAVIAPGLKGRPEASSRKPTFGFAPHTDNNAVFDAVRAQNAQIVPPGSKGAPLARRADPDAPTPTGYELVFGPIGSANNAAGVSAVRVLSVNRSEVHVMFAVHGRGSFGIL